MNFANEDVRHFNSDLILLLHENIEMETYVYFNFHWEDENDWIVSFWLNMYEHSIYLKSN